MENKYYTPTIEEFHIGFEYEIFETAFNKKEGNWNKSILNTPQYFQSINWKWIAENLEKIRVKFLDREDIKSLGWKQIEYDSFQIGSFVFELNNEYKSFIYLEKDKRNVFVGKIKNKSELKKLMQQLNIQ